MTEEPAITRRERERERHRQEIVAAAEALLLERGLEATTMEEIARKSQFAVGSLYRFFASKEDLVEAVIIERSRVFAQGVVALANAPDLDFHARLDRFLETLVTEIERNVSLVVFLFSGTRPLPKLDGSSSLIAARQPFVDAVVTLVSAGQREGVLADEDPAILGVVLMALVDGMTKHLIFAGRTDFSSMLPTVRRAFLAGYGTTDRRSPASGVKR